MIAVIEEVDGAVREEVLVPFVVVVAVVVVVVGMSVTMTDKDTAFCFLTLFTSNVHRPPSTTSKDFIVSIPVSETT